MRDRGCAKLSGRGVNAVGEAVNVRDGEAYKAWLERTAAALGGCDIFIPNVSAGGGMDSEKNWVKNFEVDVLHTVRGCEALMPHLEKSRARARSSSSPRPMRSRPSAAPMAYNAMKAALITYRKQLSQFTSARRACA